MTGLALIPADAIAIGVGAFFGALARYQVGRVAAEYIANDPTRFGKFTGWHTAGINIGGSFLLGGIAASPTTKATTTAIKPPPSPMMKPPPVPSSPPAAGSRFSFLPKPMTTMQGLSPRAKLMFGVGFCGSYTTFSTYSVDVVTWLSQGQTGKALSYVATNNVGGILAAAAGMVLVKKFFG